MNKMPTQVLPELAAYRLEEEIGRGAMGIVYKGAERSTGRDVAIKIFDLTKAGSSKKPQPEITRQAFWQEVMTAGSLHHNNIVKPYDADQAGDMAYIVMERVEGHDLRHYIKSGHLLPAELALELIAQCAETLDYAHKRQVVHLDIKPANIMYLPQLRTLKITDFGVAHFMGAQNGSDVVLGSPSYMSPEQLLKKKVDGRSDLFSLGCVLYQLISGRLPFTSDKLQPLIRKIIREPHTDLGLFLPELPECIDYIMNIALAKKPSNRFQDGLEMAQALRDCKEEIQEI
ncbi:MAG TPA: serine/threonine protein kinase [Chromatiales bacterium]|nr:serine/threonine protein kinase [Thiotrichales bacterium]HIP68327.1 serine/threonine protein kinase [Chromatiales bacterium]